MRFLAISMTLILVMLFCANFSNSLKYDGKNVSPDDICLGANSEEECSLGNKQTGKGKGKYKTAKKRQDGAYPSERQESLELGQKKEVADEKIKSKQSGKGKWKAAKNEKELSNVGKCKHKGKMASRADKGKAKILSEAKFSDQLFDSTSLHLSTKEVKPKNRGKGKGKDKNAKDFMDSEVEPAKAKTGKGKSAKEILTAGKEKMKEVGKGKGKTLNHDPNPSNFGKEKNVNGKHKLNKKSIDERESIQAGKHKSKGKEAKLTAAEQNKETQKHKLATKDKGKLINLKTSNGKMFKEKARNFLETFKNVLKSVLETILPIQLFESFGKVAV